MRRYITTIISKHHEVNVAKMILYSTRVRL